MLQTRLRAVTLFLAASTTMGYAFQSSPANRPWPPGVQNVPVESPALSPADALRTFYMPPGYHLELVASEPLIQDPIAIDWDPDGRLWAVEFPEYVRDLQAPEPNLDPIGRVVVLEDTNRDGRMDKRTVFADGLVQARAVKVLDHGILVGEPPNVWLMHDTNGDLRMDSKELVATGFGRREAGVEGNANMFFWGMDNWLHPAGSGIETHLRLKDDKFETQPTLPRGEWGVTQDDAGRMYRNSSESPMHVDFVPTPYFARNPNLVRTRGSYETLVDEQRALYAVWPVRPTPGTNRAYQFGIDRPDGTLAEFTAACAPVVYRGDRLPAELYGNLFVAEPAANLVSRIVIDDDGATLRARKAYQGAEFLASTDERFRPVFLANAPDGTLYIVDMYRGVIQDRSSTTLYLRDRIISRKLEQPIAMGRIYRVMHETTRRDRNPALTSASPMQLVDALSHPNGWWRDTAQRLLVERGATAGGSIVPSVVPALVKLAEIARDPRTRVHALWTLDGIDKIEPALVATALGDASRDVRLSAIRIAERWMADPKSPIQAALLKRLDDPDWAVRQQLAAALGLLPPEVRNTAMVTLLDRYANDPIVVDAALSGLRAGESTVLQALLQSRPEPAPTRETAITMLSATVVRGGSESAVQDLLSWVADEQHPAWQRSAVLRGIEVALGVPGVAMPGTPRRIAQAPSATADAPCPTCPGGRRGPGGAYAFDDMEAFRVSNSSAGRGGGRTLRLNREPAALGAAVGRADELARRFAAVAARIEWPGKPGAASPVAPLAPEEQARFDAGREVYRNVCQACHQPDGRGQDKLGANLVGSALALAAAEIPVRILLNGKEGAIGLMPPIGSMFSDDQIAAVLTYIRREWGQAGAPVDPATVASTRTLVAGRTRPWTNDELMLLIGQGRGASIPIHGPTTKYR